ncbi:ABCB6, partial [Symbiodinium microadriaticum]
VSFRYPSQSPDKGLCHVSFFVAPGTTTAIVGSSGSGKTTISRLIFRFYNPCRGCVKLGGYDISEYTQASVLACVGIVPQDTSLFNDTLLHNIRYGRRSATLEEVEAAAEAAQIKEFIEALPDKWNTQVGERGLRLSGGEKQRIAIARCLLKNPPIVILDEATSALDSVTERSVQDALGRLSLHRTVIIVAHRLSTIMHADNIIVINAGRVVEQGSHRELLDRGGQYQCLWESQYREQQQEQALDD